MALKCVTLLQEKQPELGIDERDIQCLAIAGLCHDLGHGPFSHLFDGPFLGSILPEDEKWNHEVASTMLFNAMLDENPHFRIKKGSSEAKFIRALIEGRSADCPLEKRFLFDIVNNERNSLDVDKIDYLERDCILIPYTPCKASLILEHIHVQGDEICYPQQHASLMAHIFSSRFNLHRECYGHVMCHAYDLMIVDVLKECQGVLCDFTKVIHQPDAYVLLDDSIIDRVKESADPRLKRAQEIIQRIEMKQPYFQVGEKFLEREVALSNWKKISEEAVLKAFAAFEENSGASTGTTIDDSTSAILTTDDIIVYKFKMNHGFGEKYPLDYAKFYDLNDKEFKAGKLDDAILQDLRPTETILWKVRCFARCHKDDPKFQIAQKAFQSYCKTELGGDPDSNSQLAFQLYSEFGVDPDSIQ